MRGIKRFVIAVTTNRPSLSAQLSGGSCAAHLCKVPTEDSAIFFQLVPRAAANARWHSTEACRTSPSVTRDNTTAKIASATGIINKATAARQTALDLSNL